jgi:hypothetical protein
MAPKKLIDQPQVSRQSLLHANTEEENYCDAENNLPLNQEGALNPMFDPIVASPSGKGKSQASSASNCENSYDAA